MKCEPGKCWLAGQWWAREGRYCTEHAVCWRAACQPKPAPVTISSSTAA